MRYLVVAMLAAVMMTSGCRTPRPTSTVDIVGGEPVGAGARIAQVTVALINAQNHSFCTGTLIGPDLIMTAAHCPEPVKIAFGTYVEPGQPNATRIRPVKSSWASPCFDFTAGEDHNMYGFDIRLVMFEGGVPEGFGPPIAVAPAALDLPLESAVVAAGFGKTRPNAPSDGYLRQVDLVTKSDGSYSKKLIQLAGGPGRVLGKSLCQGDSGGPTFIEGNDGLTLLGVNSHLVGDIYEGNCRDGSAVVDLRVHHAWIDQVASALRAGSTINEAVDANHCINPTDRSKSLAAYKDDSRGRDSCRIRIDADPARHHVTSEVYYYAPDCRSNGIPVIAPDPVAMPTMLLDVSAPEGVEAVRLCDDQMIEQGQCRSQGLAFSHNDGESGKGRACFQYRLQTADIGKSGRLVLFNRSGSNEITVDRYELGYLPCPPSQGPAASYDGP